MGEDVGTKEKSQQAVFDWTLGVSHSWFLNVSSIPSIWSRLTDLARHWIERMVEDSFIMFCVS